MRSIKFRAFNKKTGKVEAFSAVGVKLSPEFDLSVIVAHADGVIMQYTGLKDKNGQEIYEGDIVRNGNGVVGEIIFYDGAFCWERGDGSPWTLSESHADHWQVIGNIHENPELLK